MSTPYNVKIRPSNDPFARWEAEIGQGRWAYSITRLGLGHAIRKKIRKIERENVAPERCIYTRDGQVRKENFE